MTALGRHHKGSQVLDSRGYMRSEQKRANVRIGPQIHVSLLMYAYACHFQICQSAFSPEGVGAVQPEIGNTRTVRSNALKVAVPTLFAN